MVEGCCKFGKADLSHDDVALQKYRQRNQLDPTSCSGVNHLLYLRIYVYTLRCIGRCAHVPRFFFEHFRAHVHIFIYILYSDCLFSSNPKKWIPTTAHRNLLRHGYNDGWPASKACACHLHVPRWRRLPVEWGRIDPKVFWSRRFWSSQNLFLNFEFCIFLAQIKEMEDGPAYCATVCEMHFMFKEALFVSDSWNIMKLAYALIIPLTSGKCPA